MINRNVQKLSEIIVEFSANTFSKYLETAKNTKLIEICREKGFKYEFLVPRNLCIGTKRPLLACSSILALFDELSTFSIMAKDKSHRPGVSVHLSTEIFQTIYPQETLTMFVKGDKIGKTLGFCSLEVFNRDGKLIARGKHIKYLPMGFFWDFLNYAFILPIALNIYELLMKTAYFSNILKNKKHLNDDKNVDPQEVEIFNEFNVISDKENKYHRNQSYVNVTPSLMNAMGALHGGAAAMIIEKIHLDNALKANDNKFWCMNSIELTYLSSMKGELLFTHEDSSEFSNINRIRKYHGNISNSKSTSPCLQYACTWTE